LSHSELAHPLSMPRNQRFLQLAKVETHLGMKTVMPSGSDVTLGLGQTRGLVSRGALVSALDMGNDGAFCNMM
jgi:hypothetical protein